MPGFVVTSAAIAAATGIAKMALQHRHQLSGNGCGSLAVPVRCGYCKTWQGFRLGEHCKNCGAPLTLPEPEHDSPLTLNQD